MCTKCILLFYLIHLPSTGANFAQVETLWPSQNAFIQYASLIRQHQVDLIIIDYLLSSMNGGEVCHQIKSCPETAHLPVIIFSAYPRVLESLDSYGCDRFIPKPFNLEDIVNQISSLLNCSTNHYFDGQCQSSV